MDQIVVPQFLDVEDKIIGFVTVRQFIELMICGMIIFILFKTLDFSAFAVFGLLILGISLVVAFLRINGQPFHYFLLNFISTFKNPKLKLWKREISIADIKLAQAKPPQEKVIRPMAVRQPVSSSKLSELSLIVDTGGVYRGENGI